jgi:hypothetical protein
MKWVVYALLAVNLGLLTWNLLTRGPDRPAPQPAAAASASPADDDAPTLPLLTELAKDSLRERSTAEDDAPASAEAPPVGAGLPANPPPDSAPPPTTSTTQPPAPAEAPPVGAGLPANPPVDSAPEPIAPTDPPPPRTCLTLGPLDNTAPLTEIQAWLEQRGAIVDIRTDERREVALYWIYFPPFTSRREAVAQVERMREEGISDVIVVPKGDMENAVSLGVFSRTETRDRRLRELNAKGYQPSISPRYRTTLATWMDVSAPEDAIRDDAVRARWPDLELVRKPCSGGQIAADASPSYNPEQPPRPARRFFFSGQAADQAPGAGSGTR